MKKLKKNQLRTATYQWNLQTIQKKLSTFLFDDYCDEFLTKKEDSRAKNSFEIFDNCALR